MNATYEVQPARGGGGLVAAGGGVVCVESG